MFFMDEKLFQQFINDLNNLFIFWNDKSLHFLLFIRNSKQIKHISSNFNFDVYLDGDNEVSSNEYFLQLDITREPFDINFSTSQRRIGWIDLPFLNQNSENLKQQRDDIIIDKNAISVPLNLDCFQVCIFEDRPDCLLLEFYICLQAMQIDSTNFIFKLSITNNEYFLSHLNDIIFIEKFKLPFSENYKANLIINESTQNNIEFLPYLIHNGFNHQQIFLSNCKDKSCEISLYYNNVKKTTHSFSIFKKCIENNISHATTLYTGRQKTLQTTNAKLVLPDVENKDYEAKIISIERYVKFVENCNNFLIQNGIFCLPDGPLEFEAEIFIKLISQTDCIKYKNKTIKKTGDKEYQIKLKVEHFCPIRIEEILDDKTNIPIERTIFMKRFQENVEVYFYHPNHKPVSNLIHYYKII